MFACIIQGQAAACTEKPPFGNSTFAEDSNAYVRFLTSLPWLSAETSQGPPTFAGPSSIKDSHWPVNREPHKQ